MTAPMMIHKDEAWADFVARAGDHAVPVVAVDALLREVVRARRADAERVAAVEQRIQQLEARPELRYRGVWREGGSYHGGWLVTRAGGLWYAERPTTLAPGSGPGWKLIVKSGAAE